MGKLLKIDLSRESIEVQDATHLQKDYIGGLGINTRLAYDLIPPGADPLGPENVLLFGAGALVGTMLPTASRSEASAKSPLTGRFGTANAGLYFGAGMKFAGFDNIVIHGKSKRPVYITINDGSVGIEDASHLWGKDTWQTVDEIRIAKGAEFQIASIGQAGENLVRYASIQNGYYAAWGRTGMGAVMGSKNLKAVAVHGTQDVRVSDFPGFLKIMKEAFRKVKADASFGIMKRYGSMAASDPANRQGGLAARNFTSGSVENWEATRGRRVFAEKFKERDLACFSCPIACAHWARVKEGRFKGYEAKGVEVAWVAEFGGRVGVETIPEILRCAELCHRYGMDVISTAGTIAFAMEIYQRGLLNRETAGMKLEWGDLEGISRLMAQIAAREGIGDVLAEGVRKASQRIEGSREYAFHIKGLEMPGRDPRGKWDVWVLGFLTNTRGGDSLRTRPPTDGRTDKVGNYLEEPLAVPVEFVAGLDMPDKLKREIFGDPPSKVDIPMMAKYSETLSTILNSVGLCNRPTVLRSLGPDFIARALSLVTGINYTAEELIRIAEDIWDLQHQFNLREGETREEYALPSRFYEEDLPA
ncbi:aldehyde ferredoxin oxidoreductase family protein, partial [Thermodesulfobacteriota bacterium]